VVKKRRVSKVHRLLDETAKRLDEMGRRLSQAESTSGEAFRGHVETDAELSQLRRNLIRLARGDVPTDWCVGTNGGV
jgi:hypothetical protein